MIGYASATEAWQAAMTYEEWWAEWESNACCPDSVTAARRLCGCGGSAQVPFGISRLLKGEAP